MNKRNNNEIETKNNENETNEISISLKESLFVTTIYQMILADPGKFKTDLGIIMLLSHVSEGSR